MSQFTIVALVNVPNRKHVVHHVTINGTAQDAVDSCPHDWLVAAVFPGHQHPCL